MHHFSVLIFTVSLIVLFAQSCAQIRLSPRGDESKYTRQEQQALVKFRKVVKKDLYADYMHRDEYLIPWLRTRKLDVGKAAELLRANLKWRKDENVDDFPNESFPQFEATYKTDLQARTRDKMPVVLFPYSSWDVRKAALAGQAKQLIRYMMKTCFEMPQLKAREEGQADGTNATRFVMLADLSGYNLRQQGCVRCMEVPLAYVRNFEAHYPQSAAATLIINTPKIFDPVVQLTRPVMSEYYFKALQMLGPDKDDWKAKLDVIIDPNELPKRYGGKDSRQI